MPFIHLDRGYARQSRIYGWRLIARTPAVAGQGRRMSPVTFASLSCSPCLPLIGLSAD
jgi:hypothetical protein